MNVAIQSYNYGGGYVGYVAGKERNIPLTLQRALLVKIGWKESNLYQPDSRCENGGWRYGYGNMFYVELVNQYLTVPQVSGELAQR